MLEGIRIVMKRLDVKNKERTWLTTFEVEDGILRLVSALLTEHQAWVQRELEGKYQRVVHMEPDDGVTGIWMKKEASDV